MRENPTEEKLVPRTSGMQGNVIDVWASKISFSAIIRPAVNVAFEDTNNSVDNGGDDYEHPE